MSSFQKQVLKCYKLVSISPQLGYVLTTRKVENYSIRLFKKASDTRDHTLGNKETGPKYRLTNFQNFRELFLSFFLFFDLKHINKFVENKSWLKV